MHKGSLVALVTPFDSNDRVDYAALERLVEFHIDEGTDGLVIAGTTGESPTLQKFEHAELIRNAVRFAAGRLPVIAGTGSNSTRQTIELSAEVADTGIDGYLLVVPYYNKPTQEGLYQHFWAVAESIDKPAMIYNVPGRTVADILPETLARLAEHRNIVATKDATGDMERMRANLAALPDDFLYFSGDDFTTREFIELGGHGVVTVSGNVAPRLMADMCRAAASGQAELASQLDERLEPLNTALFVESNPIPVKWALAEMGLISASIRLPLTAFSERYHAQMRAAMAQASVSTGVAA